MLHTRLAGGGLRRIHAVSIAFLIIIAACSRSDNSTPSGGGGEADTLAISSQPANEYDRLAAAFYDSQILPADGLPPGFIEIERLLGECIASFGVEVFDPEAAYRSGVYWFKAETQPERVDAAQAACSGELLRRGVLILADQEVREVRYAAFIEVHDCLREHGYPTSTPPSKEAFVDSPDNWDPWAAMIGVGRHLSILDVVSSTGPQSTYVESLTVCPRP